MVLVKWPENEKRQVENNMPLWYNYSNNVQVVQELLSKKRHNQ